MQLLQCGNTDLFIVQVQQMPHVGVNSTGHGDLG